MGEFEDKVSEAKASIKLAAEMSEYYYHKPLVLCYSGGKDSEVIVDLAKKCLQPNQFEVVHNHTTADAPETVYHIREIFAELNGLGVKTTVSMPTYKGEPITMWKLIEMKGFPPTRMIRYCCKYLKERTISNRFICMGIREAEGPKRQGRDIFQKLGYDKRSNEYRSLQHTYAMFELQKTGKYEIYTCKIIEACKENGNMICNPIYHFSDDDIWEYIRQEKVKINPLYALGFKRIGCIGCPLAGDARRKKDFERYPKYKENYIKTFERMQKRNEAKGTYNKYNLTTGEQWFNWWIGEKNNQIHLL